MGFVEILINVEVDIDVNLSKENLGYLQNSTEGDNCGISSGGEDSSFGWLGIIFLFTFLREM